MTLRRLAQSRWLKWLLTHATLAAAAIYALSLASGGEVEQSVGKPWKGWVWVMRGRVEMAFRHYSDDREDAPFRLVMEPWPIDSANDHHDWKGLVLTGYRRFQWHPYPWFETRPDPRFVFKRSRGSFSSTGESWLYIAVPMWCPVVLFAMPTIFLWRLQRKPQPGCCKRCGYDLTGLVCADGHDEEVDSENRCTGKVDSETRPTVCPECGQAYCGGKPMVDA